MAKNIIKKAALLCFLVISYSIKVIKSEEEDENECAHSQNKMLCLPENYSKFELPYVNSVNMVEIGIDISDVLRINDKVS